MLTGVTLEALLRLSAPNAGPNRTDDEAEDVDPAKQSIVLKTHTVIPERPTNVTWLWR